MLVINLFFLLALPSISKFYGWIRIESSDADYNANLGIFIKLSAPKTILLFYPIYRLLSFCIIVLTNIPMNYPSVISSNAILKSSVYIWMYG
ncbi:hypothetical protein HZS_7710 [Henneguya salminicola]|nr:hypothetical protein HZS_7710 [Henneguya salminicola]